jgi:hypothetical protein
MLGNLSPQVQKSVIDRMTKRPKLIAMDTMNFWMDIAMDDLKKEPHSEDGVLVYDRYDELMEIIRAALALNDPEAVKIATLKERGESVRVR